MLQPIQPPTPAPDFTLQDQEGQSHTLSQYKGKWVLIYFYPKDDTPGCTTQACGLRDAWDSYKQAGVTVLGISKDNTKSHAKFAQKHNLPFPLLADTDTKVCQSYGIWAPKKFMGKEFLGIHRISFLINPQGNIQKTYEKVEVTTHAQTILSDITTFSKEA